jgi:hypothetical protein
MNMFAFPLRYLSLESERGRRLYWLDAGSIAAVTILTSAPFIAFDQANFFHKDGFVDKVGTFSSVLTGFYVAGLVAVATFARDTTGIDKVIEVGRVRMPIKGREPEYLTRREYVCSMFGYLAFVSMALTIASIVCVTALGTNLFFKGLWFHFNAEVTHLSASPIRAAVIIFFNLALSSLLVTTVRGLYYLIGRLYDRAPTPLPRDDHDR